MQESAQNEFITSDQPANPPPNIFPPPSPLARFLPFIMLFFFILLVIASMMIVRVRFNRGSSNKTPVPTKRPTATPFPIAPTVPEVTKEADVSIPAAQKELGSLAFIKDGDIYQSDFKTFSLLYKNEVPGGDKLAWSRSGNFLSWRSPDSSATPSALTVYDWKKAEKRIIQAGAAPQTELIDYQWSAADDRLMFLLRDTSYKVLATNSLASQGAQFREVINRTTPIRQILWPDNETLLLLGSEGIIRLNPDSKASVILVASSQITFMSLSGDNKKILYSTTDSQKDSLFTINVNGENNQSIAPKPQNIDMGTTNLTADILDKGFIPYALFFPQNDHLLLVGYKYLENLPLVGIYDTVNSSFKALTPFTLKKDDFLIDDSTLVGERVKTGLKETPNWQLTIYTMEGGSKLGLIRVIPGAVSPAFYFSK